MTPTAPRLDASGLVPGLLRTVAVAFGKVQRDRRRPKKRAPLHRV